MKTLKKLLAGLKWAAAKAEQEAHQEELKLKSDLARIAAKIKAEAETPVKAAETAVTLEIKKL